MLEAGQKVGAAQVPGDARVLYSCGAPMKGVNLRIVHPDSAQPCEDGHVGEVWLSSLCVTAGYYNRPKLNQEVFKVCALHITAQMLLQPLSVQTRPADYDALEFSPPPAQSASMYAARSPIMPCVAQ